MLISRAFNIENVDVNLKNGAPETDPSQSACLRASFGVRCNDPIIQNLEII